MRLAQVVSNLITNAAKFTAAGGRIEVILDRADGNAVVRVRDNGRGMDAATLANVFDMFYQSTREGDRSVGGLGIGLALVRSLVALHRGQVEALSEGRGRGSEFIVRLPCVDNAAPADRARLEGESVPLCMLVDDDRDPADTTALLLELQRYVATTVYDCEEAVARAIARRPDVTARCCRLRRRQIVARALHSLVDTQAACIRRPVMAVSYGNHEHRFAATAWFGTEGMKVSWGGVFAGVLVAMGVSMLLASLGVAIGISAVNPGVTEPVTVGIGAAIWGGLQLLLALFVGGMVATRVGAIIDRTTGSSKACSCGW